MDSATLVLVRHCASMGQDPAAELTPAGVAAADELAGRLLALSPDAIYSSPYRRAVATVEPLAKRAGLTIKLDERLKDRVLADRDLPDWMDHIERSFEDWDHTAPGGESLARVRDRGLAALGEIAGSGHRMPVIASHGNLISALLCSVDSSFGFKAWKSLRNPELFELTFEDGRLTAWSRMD